MVQYENFKMVLTSKYRILFSVSHYVMAVLSTSIIVFDGLDGFGVLREAEGRGPKKRLVLERGL